MTGVPPTPPRDLDGVAILYDLDGTFIDTAADLAGAMNHVLGEAGLSPLPTSAVRHLVGFGAKAMIEAGFKAAGAPISSDEAAAQLPLFLDYYGEHIADYSRPFPGAVVTLLALRAAGARTAICTNKREAPARQLIAALELEACFDAIIGGDTAGVAKPDPAPVRLCLEALGVDPAAGGRAIFIGDSDTDIAAATNTDLPCLLARFGYGPTKNAAMAAAAFDDYEELPALVRQVMGSTF